MSKDTHCCSHSNILLVFVCLCSFLAPSPCRATRALPYKTQRYVAIGFSNKLFGGAGSYSSDGILWESITNSEFNGSRVAYVAFGAGRFVGAGGSDGIVWSKDGVTWTRGSLQQSARITALAYGGGRFVLATEDATGAYSADGAVWTLVPSLGLPNALSVSAIGYGSNVFVAGNEHGDGVWSYDGVVWTSITSTQCTTITAVAYGGGRFVWGGARSSHQNTTSAWSTDGKSWFPITGGSILNNGMLALAYGAGRFVAVGHLGRGATSTDGVLWESIPDTNVSSNILAAEYGGGRFVISDEKGIGSWSLDGRTWQRILDLGVNSKEAQSLAYGELAGEPIPDPGTVFVIGDEPNGLGYVAQNFAGLHKFSPLGMTLNPLIAFSGSSAPYCTYLLPPDNNGSIWVFGNGPFCGNGLTLRWPLIMNLPFTQSIVQVAAGMNFVFVLTANGTLYGMGDNGYQQFGSMGSLNSFVNIIPDVGVTRIRQVLAGESHAAVLTDDNVLYTSGRTLDYQTGFVGNPLCNCIRWTSLSTAVKSVALGANHTIYSRFDGSLYGTGANREQQANPFLSDPRAQSRRLDVLFQIPADRRVESVFAGKDISFYIDSFHDIRVWGRTNALAAYSTNGPAVGITVPTNSWDGVPAVIRSMDEVIAVLTSSGRLMVVGNFSFRFYTAENFTDVFDVPPGVLINSTNTASMRGLTICNAFSSYSRLFVTLCDTSSTFTLTSTFDEKMSTFTLTSTFDEKSHQTIPPFFQYSPTPTLTTSLSPFPSWTSSSSATHTPTPRPTATPPPTVTPASTRSTSVTSSSTPTTSNSSTASPTPPVTSTPSFTSTRTNTVSITPGETPSSTRTGTSASASASWSRTDTAPRSASPTSTPTVTKPPRTSTPIVTFSRSPTYSESATLTSVLTPTPSPSPTLTSTVTLPHNDHVPPKYITLPAIAMFVTLLGALAAPLSIPFVFIAADIAIIAAQTGVLPAFISANTLDSRYLAPGAPNCGFSCDFGAPVSVACQFQASYEGDALECRSVLCGEAAAWQNAVNGNSTNMTAVASFCSVTCVGLVLPVECSIADDWNACKLTERFTFMVMQTTLHQQWHFSKRICVSWLVFPCVVFAIWVIASLLSRWAARCQDRGAQRAQLVGFTEKKSMTVRPHSTDSYILGRFLPALNRAAFLLIALWWCVVMSPFVASLTALAHFSRRGQTQSLFIFGCLALLASLTALICIFVCSPLVLLKIGGKRPSWLRAGCVALGPVKGAAKMRGSKRTECDIISFDDDMENELDTIIEVTTSQPPRVQGDATGVSKSVSNRVAKSSVSSSNQSKMYIPAAAFQSSKQLRQDASSSDPVRLKWLPEERRFDYVYLFVGYLKPSRLGCMCILVLFKLVLGILIGFGTADGSMPIWIMLLCLWAAAGVVLASPSWSPISSPAASRILSVLCFGTGIVCLLTVLIVRDNSACNLSHVRRLHVVAQVFALGSVIVATLCFVSVSLGAIALAVISKYRGLTIRAASSAPLDDDSIIRPAEAVFFTID